MRRLKAALGALVFLAVAPGVVAGLIPWWLTGWEVHASFVAAVPVRMAGAVLLVAGAAVLLEAFVRFAVQGLGTPAPIAPTEYLVVGGLYRYVRNPMYLAVGATIVGQAFALGQPILLLYVAAFGVAVAAFVHWHEEPALRRRFGGRYDTYRSEVPAWWPRVSAWRAPSSLDR